MHDVWLGRDYHLPEHRVLILGESWYGEVEALETFIPKWAARQLTDATFSRLFNACSGARAETATEGERLDWWHRVAFYNFVTGTVGDTRSSRPTRAQYEAARAPLAAVLAELRPAGVWVLGKEQSAYSAPVITDHGTVYEVAPHPTSYGVRSEVLCSSWRAINVHACR